jgi:hypothetical protein
MAKEYGFMKRYAARFLQTDVRFANGLRSHAAGAMALGVAASLMVVVVAATANDAVEQTFFRRIATFPVFLNTCDGQLDNNDCINATTVSEIIAASEDGRLLIYTDSATRGSTTAPWRRKDCWPYPAGSVCHR